MSARPFMDPAWNAIDPALLPEDLQLSEDLMNVVCPLLAYWPEVLGCPEVGLFKKGRIGGSFRIGVNVVSQIRVPGHALPRILSIWIGLHPDPNQIEIVEHSVYTADRLPGGRRIVNSVDEALTFIATRWTHTDIEHLSVY